MTLGPALILLGGAAFGVLCLIETEKIKYDSTWLIGILLLTAGYSPVIGGYLILRNFLSS